MTDNFHRFKVIEPKAFHIRDLVEVMFSFVIILASGGMHKLMAILKSIVLVNDSFAKVRIVALCLKVKNS